MVRRCCIVTCKNGFSCDERVSFFRVPKKPALFEKWARVVAETGSTLYKTSSICEKHFRDDEIKRDAVCRDSFGNIIFQRPLIKCALLRDVIPSIFENDLDGPPRKIRKRPKHVVAREQNEIALANANAADVQFGNILISFHENLSSTIQYNVVENPIGEPSKDRMEENNANAPYETNFQSAVQQNPSNNAIRIISDEKFSPDSNIARAEHQKSIIQILMKAQENAVGNAVHNNIENSNVSAITNLDHRNSQIPKEDNQITIENADETIKTNNNINNSLHYPLPESDIQLNIRAFDLIFHNSHKIRLPNPMWAYHKNSIDKDIIIFSKAKWFKSNVLIPPIYEKQVIFHESDNIKIYINTKFSPLEVRRPRDIHEMEIILKSVDETIVCSGGPNLGECDTAHCAQKDYAVSRWRHKLCPIILSNDQTICKFCATINQVMRYPRKKRLPFGRRRPVLLEDTS